ncbi:hypothetical protein ZIOFF_038592 [Zingiber officinale]|uniref:SAUR family protein n=1 Tax=Zingiber officinale TaxID=94328 RepID=A0A8J5GEU0_ZINOF|nr:hypothetical protein ZIOFF_038592 [Zingiber officinale]
MISFWRKKQSRKQSRGKVVMGAHLHLLHLRRGEGEGGEGVGGIRKGWIGIRVGAEGEERRRFEVPVEHLSHPLFAELLKAAEEEYGFRHQGAITIPCAVDHFRSVQTIIHRDCNFHHHHNFHLCFRPSP